MTVADQQYYSEVPEGGIAERVLIAARRRIFRDFLATMQPAASDRIVDIGVSDIVNDGANVLERSYPFQENITACGVGAGVAFQAAFPRAQYRQIAPDNHLPFADGAFDIAASNAVLEHVGSVANQRAFVDELCRVAKRVFISVPNRYFPVEHHTTIPFAHWNDVTFRSACRLFGKREWAEEKNLILMSRGRLRALAGGCNATVGYTGLKLGPFSSNLYLTIG